MTTHIEKVTFNYKGKQIDLEFGEPKKIDEDVWVMLGRPHSTGNYVWKETSKKRLMDTYNYYFSTKSD